MPILIESHKQTYFSFLIEADQCTGSCLPPNRQHIIHWTSSNSVHWCINASSGHDDVIKWKHFPRYWPFVRGVHRSPMNSPHKSKWHWVLMLCLICAWINGWVNHREAGDLRRQRKRSLGRHCNMLICWWNVRSFVMSVDDLLLCKLLHFSLSMLHCLLPASYLHENEESTSKVDCT